MTLGSDMTIGQALSTDGHGGPGQAIGTKRRGIGARIARQWRVRPRRLLLPTLLALAIILILRHFEQSTAG